MLDRTLEKEIKRLNGDGSREARFDTIKKLRAAMNDLSTPKVMYTFNDCLRAHGRAAVSVCVAATLYERRERIDRWGLSWAKAVLALWTNRTPSMVESICIRDQLHPTRICDYANSLIKLTTQEP